jgi:hypothetical protein
MLAFYYNLFTVHPLALFPALIFALLLWKFTRWTLS